MGKEGKVHAQYCKATFEGSSDEQLALSVRYVGLTLEQMVKRNRIQEFSPVESQPDKNTELKPDYKIIYHGKRFDLHVATNWYALELLKENIPADSIALSIINNNHQVLTPSYIAYLVKCQLNRAEEARKDMQFYEMLSNACSTKDLPFMQL